MKKIACLTFGISFALQVSLGTLPSFAQLSLPRQAMPAISPPPTTFGSLSRDSTFAEIYFYHLQARPKSDTELFHSIWFLSNDARISMICSVDTSGKQHSGRYVHNWAFQGGDSLNLNTGRLKALHSALHSLPPSAGRVSVADLLLLNYQDGNVWRRREYDRKHLPEKVRQVYRLIGAGV